jgi:hypothetical protein
VSRAGPKSYGQSIRERLEELAPVASPVFQVSTFALH